MNWLWNFFLKCTILYAGEPGGGGESDVSAADARAFLGDFLPPDTVKSMDDAAVLTHHKQFSSAITKHGYAKAQQNGGDWYSGFQDPTVKEWLGAYKGAYPNAEAVALKALNLEKFVGADKANRGIVVPKADAKPEEWAAFWRKAGAAEKVDAYELPAEQAKDPMYAAFREHAHKIGMPLSQYKATLAWWGGQLAAAQKTQVQGWEQQAEQELTELNAEWGAQADAKTEAGRRAVAAFIPGTPEERETIVNKMEGALGTKFTMNFWASIGEKLGEHGFVTDGDQPGDGRPSPEAARLEIADLKKDKEFAKKLLAGDADSTAKWNKLHSIGYPGQQVL